MNHHRLRSRARAIALVVLSAIGVGPAHATCPSSCFMTSRTFVCLPDSAASYQYGTSEARDCTASGAYDVILATMSSSTGCGFASDSLAVSVSDVFTLSASGPPHAIYFTIRMHVVWAGAGWTITAGRITDGTGSIGPSWTTASGDTSFTFVDKKDSTTPFTLTFTLVTTAAESGIGASADYDFDLPPGVTISSCRGFHAQPVPTRGATWGAVKIRYR